MRLNFTTKRRLWNAFVCGTLLTLSLNVFSQTSTYVYYGQDNKLMYKADAKGNTVPDFSGVGYMNSEKNIPVVKVVKTVTAVSGDNLANVQNAINEVAAMPIGADGFRGAILFKKGEYRVSNTINITTSGIVLVGEGFDAAGTRFIATRAAQHSLFNFAGSSSTTTDEATKKKIVDLYVPYSATKVTVESGHTFQAGNRVHVRREPTTAWIQLLGMDTLTRISSGATNWTASGYKVSYERQVLKVDGNDIYLDAPVMDIIEPTYAAGYVVKFSSARIQNCGIENMRLSSEYISNSDENHGWHGVFFNNIENAWARNIEVYYFGYSAVNVGEKACWVTVDACKMLDPKSQTTGGRKYSFNVDGQRALVKNCVTRGGRHDFVNGSQTAGPSVFFNGTSTQVYADIGPHHRWSTGILFDKINSSGAINVQNRLASGSGHGWAGAQIMFWNCKGSKLICQDIPSDHTNWAIGCIGNVTGSGDWISKPIGVVESKNTYVTPSSLFEAQLAERLKTIKPATPYNLTATAVESNKINLAWPDVPTNEDSYKIERSLDGMNFTELVIKNANTVNYTDTGLIAGTKYYYRISASNSIGTSGNSNIANATTLVSSIGLIKTSFTGFKCSVNPANNAIEVSYTLSKPSNVWLEIIDAQGRILDVLSNAFQSAGSYKTSWGKKTTRGLIFVRLTTDNFAEVKKVIR